MWMSLLLALMGCETVVPAAPTVGPRHVVIVSMDTVRADVMGFLGDKHAHTPRLDELASRSWVFTQHTSAAPTTLASHTSLFTGLYPHRHGVPRNEHVVHPSNRTLAEVFRDEGFTTAAFIGGFPMSEHSGVLQGFDHVDATFTHQRQQGQYEQSERSAAEVNAAVKAFLDAHDATEERLFLFVHYFDAHQPYTPPGQLTAVHRAIQPSADMEAIYSTRKQLRDNIQDSVAVARSMQLLALYRTEVTAIDRAIRELETHLLHAKIWPNHLMVVTADHGESWAWHREIWDHGHEVYQETVHTPLLMQWPGGGDGIVAEPVSNVDVFPTILGLFGLESGDVDGVDLAPVLTGGSRGGPVFAEATKPYEPGEDWVNAPRRKVVRDGPWTLIQDPQRPEGTELYNLVDDDKQQRNLALDDAHQEQRAALETQMAEWLKTRDPKPTKRVSDQTVIDRLKALGYTD